LLAEEVARFPDYKETTRSAATVMLQLRQGIAG
jgi:hypothetical protein